MSYSPQDNYRKSRMSNSRGSPAGRASLRAPLEPPEKATSAVATTRRANIEPTYNFLTGESQSPQPSNSFPLSLRESQPPKADIGNEELRVEINTLRYELDTLKQEKELTSLQHEKELRDLQVKADADFKKAQASQSTSNITTKKYESLARELSRTKDEAASEKRGLEKRLRASQEQARTLQEDLDEAQSELQAQERQYRHQISEVESKRAALQSTLDDLQSDFESQSSLLHTAQDRLSQREQEVGRLETEVLRLKAQTGDVETLNVIKRELSDQVAHIKKLEATNRDQSRELKHFRQIHKAVEIVEEEKRALEIRLQGLDDLRRELREAQLQKHILEDEKRAWTSLLQSDGQEEEYQSPEDVARALMQEKTEKAMLIDKLGAVTPELLEKDEIIKALDDQRTRLHAEVEKLKASGGAGESKAKMRLERQRTLAIKEIEYLRAQLKTFDAEEVTLHEGNNFDEEKIKQIETLEKLIDDYRKEIQTLHTELSQRESLVPLPTTQTPQKRSHDSSSESDERLGLLTRKNRKLQTELSKMTESTALLQKELSASKHQLHTLQSASRTRILSLASNPTSDFEAIKLKTLNSLREENKILLSKLEGAPVRTKVVPVSTLENSRAETQEMAALVSEKEKRIRRLREIFTAKTQEFREAVAQLLGYKMDFLPNDRVRVTSMYNLGNADEGGDEDNSLLWDGAKGTIKVCAGENSPFAFEMRNLIRFWVEERKEIPCFLAAMTLEFFERTTRAAK
ncbi:MAG: coiled-coil domain-containing protein mad1 [Cirrosporium novae-zelandiae]|nr:MAG: coiled-coil domain-containing protein mad1 [Cirrosporium novae-zelandiae]